MFKIIRITCLCNILAVKIDNCNVFLFLLKKQILGIRVAKIYVVLSKNKTPVSLYQGGVQGGRVNMANMPM